MRMHRVLCLAFLLCGMRATPGQDNTTQWSCPQTAKLSGNLKDHWFEGTVGPKHIRMYLRRGDPEVVGLYYDVADWKPILLGGKWTDDGDLQVTASLPDSGAVAIGTLSGRISPSGNLVGTLTANGGNDGGEQSIAMKRVPQPSCDGSGAWRKFSNPKVPIAFSYPASWHAEIMEPDIPNAAGYKTVVLTCPDPMSVAYGMAVNFSPEEMDTDDKVDDFIRFDGGPWVYGCDSETRDFCRKPITIHKAGITIYRADEIEFRTDCVGGDYVGQGEGHRFLLSFDDNWMQFYGSGSPSDTMERILSTILIRK